MAQQNQKVRSGNRVVIFMDGVKVGLLQSVSMNDDYGPEPASGIGDIHVQEHVPTMARHTISVTQMVLNRGALRQLGVTAENGDDVLQGLVFDIETQSRDDNTTLRKYVGCSYASGSVDVTKHAIIVSSGQFNALDVTGGGM